MFRVIRDSELDIEEDFTPDLLKLIEGEVKKGLWPSSCTWRSKKNAAKNSLGMLCQGLNFAKEETVRISSHLDLTYLLK